MARQQVAPIPPVEIGERILFDLIGETAQEHGRGGQRLRVAALVGHAAYRGRDHGFGDVPANVPPRDRAFEAEIGSDAWKRTPAPGRVRRIRPDSGLEQ